MYIELFYFREKQNIAKSSRKLEKRVKELLLQLDDERRHADQYKEQVRSIFFGAFKYFLDVNYIIFSFFVFPILFWFIFDFKITNLVYFLYCANI